MPKKNKLASADDILKQMYPDLPTSDDNVDEGDGGAKKAGADDQIAALQAQIAELKGQMSASASRDTPAAPTRTESAPVMPVIDYSKAPDPIQEPQAYAKFVRDATQATIDYEKQAWAYQNRQQNTQANRLNDLWTTFSESHKEYAGNEDRIEVAASRAIQKALAKGVDTDKYMYEQSDKFMKDVVTEYDKLFGKPQAGEEGDDDDDDDDAEILGGAVASGGNKGGSQKAPPSKFGELSSEIKAWQQKVGIAY